MSELTKDIDRAVSEIKDDSAIRLEYMSMNAWEADLQSEARQQGIEIGEARGRDRVIEQIKSLANTGASIDMILSTLQKPPVE